MTSNMTDITEAVIMEEGAVANESSDGLRQRSPTSVASIPRPDAVSAGKRELSLASKAYDLNHNGKLDEAQQKMRELDRSGRGFIKNEELYEEFRQHMQTQKEMLSLKRLVWALIILIVVISLATLGTSFAAAILAKDTTTTNGVLVVKSDGKPVATQTNGETFLVTVETAEEQRRRHLQVIDDGTNPWQILSIALYSNDFMSLQDAQAIESKCDLGRTVYLLRQCPDGRRSHVLICGPGAGSYESGDAPVDEVTVPTTKYSYVDGMVVLLCPNTSNEGTCTASVNANYVAPCSAGTPTMTDLTLPIATTMLKNNPTQFNTLYGPVDSWDTSAVTDMSRLFASVSGNAFCGIASWDVSGVKKMNFMFDYADSFDCDLSTWDVSSVEEFHGMFRDAHAFTGQGIASWDVKSATTMRSMFDTAKAFNQDISSWSVENVVHFGSMFYGAEAFSQSLCPWGPKINAEATVVDMFTDATSCASQSAPELATTPVGPLCSACAV